MEAQGCLARFDAEFAVQDSQRRDGVALYEQAAAAVERLRLVISEHLQPPGKRVITWAVRPAPGQRVKHPNAGVVNEQVRSTLPPKAGIILPQVLHVLRREP